MLLGIWSWVLGLLAMLLVPIILGEAGWRRFLDHVDTPPRRPGMLSHAVLFGLVGPPVGMAAFLMVTSWLERDIPGSRPATDMLVVLVVFAYLSGAVPALLCGALMGALRKRVRRVVFGLPLALLSGAVLAWVFFVLAGLYNDVQEGWRAMLSGGAGALASAAIACGLWRPKRESA